MQKYKHVRHLPHSLVVQCQSIFAAFAAVASCTEYQNLVMMDLPIPLSAYAEPIQLFEDLMRDNKRTFNSSTLGIFQQPARSFPVNRDPPRPKRDRDANSSNASRQTKRNSSGDSKNIENEEAKKQGWLILENASLNFPDVLSKIPCKNHALVERFCRFTPCRFHHWSFPLDYPKADRKVICHLVASTEGAKFASSVKQSDIDAISAAPSASAGANDATRDPPTN